MLIMFIITFILAATILPSELIVILTPVVVWLASGFVNWLKSKLTDSGGFGGTVLITLIIPALSLAASFIADLIVPGLDFWSTFGLGLLAVFVNEIIKQWSQTAKGTQKKANVNLVG